MIDPRKRALALLSGGAYLPTDEVDAEAVPSDLLPTEVSTSDVVGAAPRVPEVSSGAPQQATERDYYADALKEKHDRAFNASLAGIGSRYLELVSGMGPSEATQEARKDYVNEPIAQYLQRQKEAERQRALDIQNARATRPTAASTKAQKSTDPMSVVSQRYQRAFRSQYPDAPADLIGAITEENYDNIRKTLESDARIDETAAGRKAANARAEAERILRGDIHSSDLDARYAGITAADERADKALQAAQAYRDTILGQHASEQTQKINERNVGGFSIDPQDPPSPEASKKMAETKIAYDRVKEQIQRLDGMLKANGSEVIGDKAGEMGVVWSDLTTALRLFDQMGVPNANDYVVLAKSVTDPTSEEGVKTSTSRMRAQLREVQRKMELALRATASAYKFRPAGAQPNDLPTRKPATSVLPTDSSGQPTLDPPPPVKAPRRKRDKDGQLWEEQPDGTAKKVPG